MANKDESIITYDPKDKNSVAYFIQNKANEYVETKYFVSHEVEVPVYKKGIIYGTESSTKKYKLLLSAPNMFEMFSAQPQRSQSAHSYWLNNTSSVERTAGAIYDVGVPLNETINNSEALGIRVVAFVKKKSAISSGKGTVNEPYIVQ